MCYKTGQFYLLPTLPTTKESGRRQTLDPALGSLGTGLDVVGMEERRMKTAGNARRGEGIGERTIRWGARVLLAVLAATVGAQAQTLDTTPPTLVSAQAVGSKLVMTFSEALLASATVRNTSFGLKADGATVALPGLGTVTISGSTVIVTTVASVDTTKTYTISYTKPEFAENERLQDIARNSVESFTDQTVTHRARPTAADNTVTTNEDTAHTFSAAEFGFSPGVIGDALDRVRIVTLPTLGTLADRGTAVTANDYVNKSDIDAGRLVYTPGANASGSAYASFSFRVNDGLVDSASAYTMTIDVTAVADPATGRPTISVRNVYRVPAVLTSDVSDIEDGDGMSKAEADEAGYAFAYQWVRRRSGRDTDIAGATGATYTLTAADARTNVKVRVTFTDDVGNTESVMSSPVPSTGRIRPAGACAAPTLTGGARLLGAGRSIEVEKLRHGGYGYNSIGLNAGGDLSDKTFTVGSREFTIREITVIGGELRTAQNEQLLEVKNGLELHVCGRRFRYAESTRERNGLQWRNAGLSWADHAERTVYMAHDGAAPTLVSAELLSTTVRIRFSEALGPIARAADSVFSVKADGAAVRIKGGTVVQVDGAFATFELNADADTTKSYTVSYVEDADPTGVLIDLAKNRVESFSDQPVTHRARPASADTTITTPEDTVYTFGAADFGFTPAVAGETLSSIKITTVPQAGQLKVNGVPVERAHAFSGDPGLIGSD